MIDNILGVLGALLLGGCCLPQTIKTIKLNRADDISWMFLMMWFIGELIMIVYVLVKPEIDYLLLGNYGINLSLLVPILYVKARGEYDKTIR